MEQAMFISTTLWCVWDGKMPLSPEVSVERTHTGWGKSGLTVVSPRNNLFLHYYFLINVVLFSTQKTVNLLRPTL